MERITERYRVLNRELHARAGGFGGKGRKWLPTVLAIAAHVDAQSLLDYGCGQGSLMLAIHEALRKAPGRPRLTDYDPAIPGRDNEPAPADLVVCTDVLEHVEPGCLAAVLAHLRALTQKALFLVVALDPANKILSDGRNAHLIQEPPAWWEHQTIKAGFALMADEAFAQFPLPVQHYDPKKREKRWIAVAFPC
jgi:hypothetical protein